MRTSGLQFSLAALLGLIACLAVNLWLFRVGLLWGLVGLNVSKHVGVAVLCQALGVNRPKDQERDHGLIPAPHSPFWEAP